MGSARGYSSLSVCLSVSHFIEIRSSGNYSIILTMSKRAYYLFDEHYFHVDIHTHNTVYSLRLIFQHLYFSVSVQMGSGNTLIFDKISCSLIFSIDSNFSSAIRIEHVLSLNVPYASDFVLLLLCYVHCVAEAVPINSESVTCSGKKSQILSIKHEIQPSVMSYSPTVLPIVNFMTSGGQTGSQLAVNQRSINGRSTVTKRSKCVRTRWLT